LRSNLQANLSLEQQTKNNTKLCLKHLYSVSRPPILRRNASSKIFKAAGFLPPRSRSCCQADEGKHDIGHVKASKAPEGATTGAVTGGVTGGVIGLLAGIGALAIPGVGPLIAAGPIMAALSGAAIGGTTGGVVGGLIGLGIPEIEAKRYEDKLKKGNYLISVHAHDDEQEDKAKDIFRAANAEDITTSSMSHAPAATH
jgi:hypothetical protein